MAAILAQPLAPISIAAGGFRGLNKEGSAVDLDPGWALEANNCVIDRTGRIAARKGATALTTSAVGGGANIQMLGEYLSSTGTTKVLSAANLNIYEGTTALTSLYSAGITANYWQYVNFNNYGWLFQRGHAPLRYDGTNVVTIASLGGTGTVPQGNCVLAAFGRLWIADTSTDKTTLTYSDLLAGQNYASGSAGTLDTQKVWPLGMDSIVALAAFNGYLVIFGKRQILIYSGASTPSSMVLADTVKGVGCIARDSVQDIGTDILFLSSTGVRSLARTIQTNIMPLQDISKNVRSDVVYSISQESNTDAIKSVYSETEGFYAINFPTFGVTYCLNTRQTLDDGTNPVTTWTQINPKAMLARIDGTVLLGGAGVVAQYTGYTDYTASYTMSYLTPWMGFGESSIQKILKRILCTVIGSSLTTFTIKWAFDYVDSYFTDQQVITGGSTYEYNIAEFNIAEFSTGVVIDEISSPASSTGKMVQIGVTCSISGTQLAIQKLDVYAKRGRML